MKNNLLFLLLFLSAQSMHAMNEGDQGYVPDIPLPVLLECSCGNKKQNEDLRKEIEQKEKEKQKIEREYWSARKESQEVRNHAHFVMLNTESVSNHNICLYNKIEKLKSKRLLESERLTHKSEVFKTKLIEEKAKRKSLEEENKELKKLLESSNIDFKKNAQFKKQQTYIPAFEAGLLFTVMSLAHEKNQSRTTL